MTGVAGLDDVLLSRSPDLMDTSLYISNTTSNTSERRLKAVKNTAYSWINSSKSLRKYPRLVGCDRQCDVCGVFIFLSHKRLQKIHGGLCSITQHGANEIKPHTFSIRGGRFTTGSPYSNCLTFPMRNMCYTRYHEHTSKSPVDHHPQNTCVINKTALHTLP